MPVIEVLITVKSYPTVSSHYDEQISIAGFTKDGSFIRIYPIPFSKKNYDEQYQLYSWMKFDLVRHTRDFRLESFRPVADTPVMVTGHLGTDDHWAERKAVVLKTVYKDMSTLIVEAKHEAFYTSLAVFKPLRILDFIVEETDREWDSKRIAQLEEEKNSGRFVEQAEDPFSVMKKLPYKFSYRFIDSKNEEFTLPVEDWQLASLYWKSVKKNSTPQQELKAVHEIRKKYLFEYAKHSDLHFFLGTTQQVHASSKQPFTIAGLFPPTVPPAVIQGSLF
ncbi:hypothetical protein [Chitinophaga qingshengii]|uniref:Uncharacterized protein n=1 Tax=Chitinophaga qingshengii TaxID=1569794 RepID=A0ABR7TJF0_9BACT|nr:hypothetical protein [Chitinophaga qingshengii]MBC9929549.1 hypothetical protein [Chitinophaga qingshengii]